jgi:hypothetical protein
VIAKRKRNDARSQDEKRAQAATARARYQTAELETTERVEEAQYAKILQWRHENGAFLQCGMTMLD